MTEDRRPKTEVEERSDEIQRSGNRSNTASLKPHVEPKAKSRERGESGPRAVLKERGTRNKEHFTQ